MREDTKSSSSRLNLANVLRRTQSAGTVRVVGQTSRSGGSAKPEVSKVAGTLDFAHHRNALVTRGALLGQRFEIKTRAAGDFLFISPATVRVVPPQQLNGMVFLSHGKRWVRYPYAAGSAAVGVGVGASLSPNLFEEPGGTLEHRGADLVRGVATQHYRFTVPASPVSAQVKATSFDQPQTQIYDIWVDGSSRLRRVQWIANGDHRHSRAVVDYFDFGRPAAIREPPRTEVAVDDENRLTGDWGQVQSGESGGVHWTVYRAPTTSGVCFSHESDPPDSRRGTGLMQRGRATDTCTTGEGSAFATLSGDQMTTASVALPKGQTLLYGKVRPTVRSASLHFGDGHSKTLVPDHETFAIALSADQVVAKVVLHGRHRSITCVVSREVLGYRCPAPREPRAPPAISSGDAPPIPFGSETTAPPAPPVVPVIPTTPGPVSP